MFKNTKSLIKPVILAAALALPGSTALATSAGSKAMEPSSATELSHHHKKAADIVDTAVAANQFNTLVAAVKAAGLVDTLKGDGPFTVFAPTDEAFSKLPGGTVESLLEPKNRKLLQTILTYHVIPGKVTAGDILGKRLEADTASGKKVTIDATGGEVRIDTARVIRADIMTANGVIHVIDRVITPGS